MQTAAKPKKRIFYFDALRALAIICVMLIHIFSRRDAFVFAEYSQCLLSTGL